MTVANNHGMDYGRVGLADTLAAAQRYRMPLLGAGVDQTAAWTPLRRTIHGVRISVIAATDVLDDFATTAWVAKPGVPGLASAKDTEPAASAAVRAERSKADVVVVFLHWGKETVYCPTARQQDLAHRLSDAGADIVVGSHAHVVEPTARVGRTVVDYGLGNFQFYARGGARLRDRRPDRHGDPQRRGPVRVASGHRRQRRADGSFRLLRGRPAEPRSSAVSPPAEPPVRGVRRGRSGSVHVTGRALTVSRIGGWSAT